MKTTEVVLGVVLRAERTGDADVRVQILTADGIKTCTATGAAKQGAKMASTIQMFTIAEFSITGSRITGAHVLQLSVNITKEINRYYLACSISETLLTLHGLRAGGQIDTASIFLLTARSFETLSETPTSAYKVFVNFFTKLLVLLGYDVEDFERTDKIESFKQAPDADIDMIKMSLDTAKKCVAQLVQSYSEHLDIKISCAKYFL
jgi:recombinational DNA repair protein (RecF pathway)